ncbi:MAG: hypothetical protein KAT00_11900 [Planctomycetes bacterium]|nr:hypothetical protein [Planctomycetota bacterium]
MKDSVVKICFAFTMVLWFLLFPTTVLYPEELIGYLPVVILALVPAILGNKWMRFFALIFLASSLIVILRGFHNQRIRRYRERHSQQVIRQQDSDASRSYYWVP